MSPRRLAKEAGTKVCDTGWPVIVVGDGISSPQHIAAEWHPRLGLRPLTPKPVK